MPVSMEHMIVLLAFQCFQIPLSSRPFPVWDFDVGVFSQKTTFNMRCIISTLRCHYLYKSINKCLNKSSDLLCKINHSILIMNWLCDYINPISG